MSKKRQQKRDHRKQQRARGRRQFALLASFAVVVVVGGVVAVRASGGGGGSRIHLYQGQAALGGASVALSDVVGKGEPAIVNFWASNCPPCRMEMPGFQKVYAAHNGQGYVMLGVDVGPQTGLGTHEGAQALIRQEGIHYPVGYVDGNALVTRYGLRGMPTTLFFDASGKQVGRVVGFLDESQLRQRLAALLNGG
ncbi:MAG: TlpA disulfide reductase family protein [Deinococcales bacterium]